MALVGGVAAILLAACSGGGSGTPSTPSGTPTNSDSASPSVSPSTSPTPTYTPPPAGFATLTGQPLTTAAAVTRPIVAVAVGVVPGGAAPRRLAYADVLFQEFDRVGRSRILALFQTLDVAGVGPVADTSPTDMRTLAPMGVPIYGYASGPTGFIAQVRPDVVTGRSAATAPGLFPGSFTSTVALRASAPQAAPATPGLFTFNAVPAASAKGVRKVTRIVIAVVGQPVQTWAWSGKIWVGPAGLTRNNIVVQTVVYKTLTPSKGPAVGSADVIGTGASTVFAGNLAVAGSWVRPALQQITNYNDPAGVPVSLSQGTSMVLWVPAGTKVTIT